MIPVKGYATYDKLKTCLVGRTYSKEQFQDIKNKKVKDILFRILDETEEDYQNLCKVLSIAGVETLRPDVIEVDTTHRPANQPRDDMGVIGETLYVNNNRPEYKSILDRVHNKVIVEDCEQKKLMSTSFIQGQVVLYIGELISLAGEIVRWLKSIVNNGITKALMLM